MAALGGVSSCEGAATAEQSLRREMEARAPWDGDRDRKREDLVEERKDMNQEFLAKKEVEAELSVMGEEDLELGWSEDEEEQFTAILAEMTASLNNLKTRILSLTERAETQRIYFSAFAMILNPSAGGGARKGGQRGKKTKHPRAGNRTRRANTTKAGGNTTRRRASRPHPL